MLFTFPWAPATKCTDMQAREAATQMDNARNPAVLDATREDQDLSLVRRYLAGDERAFDVLVARYQSFVYHVCLNMLANPSDAEDAAQEVFVAVHRALPGFKMRSRVSTWIYRITMNRCISQRRNRRPEAVLNDEHAAPFERFDDIEKRHDIRRLLQKMAPHYRAVLVLKYYQELSYDETAESLGWSPEKVKCYLHRARNIFKRIYEQEGGAS
jgi:RNA polymerase sigma-70 factor, ECF subfamily